MPEMSRTLVKSVPELWPKISDAEELGRCLEAFGAVTLTSTKAEELVQWEGERANGSIRLEPSGFGTKVTLLVEILSDQPPEVTPEPAPEPVVEPPEPEPPAKVGFWARMFRRKPVPVPEPERDPEPEPPVPAPAIPRMTQVDAEAALTSLLDALGFANHRPFSRA